MSDLYDDELRGALLRASGDDCDADDAFVEVHRRVRRARRRRMDLVCALLVVAMFVTLGVAARSARHTTSEGPASTVTAVPTLPSTITIATTVAPATIASAPPADAPAAPATEAPATDPAADSTVEATPPTDRGAAVAPSSGTSPSSSTSGRSSTAHTSAPKTQQTFSAAGGQVTVATTNGDLTLVSATAGPGYTAAPPWTSSSRVQVVFHSEAGDSWIRVDLVNGEPQATVGSSTDHTGSRRSIPSSTTTAPRRTTDGSGPAVSYPSGRSGSGSPTDTATGFRRH
jgi:hypothetical protein